MLEHANWFGQWHGGSSLLAPILYSPVGGQIVADIDRAVRYVARRANLKRVIHEETVNDGSSKAYNANDVAPRKKLREAAVPLSLTTYHRIPRIECLFRLKTGHELSESHRNRRRAVWHV